VNMYKIFKTGARRRTAAPRTTTCWRNEQGSGYPWAHEWGHYFLRSV
jgi:hypothetical protein